MFVKKILILSLSVIVFLIPSCAQKSSIEVSSLSYKNTDHFRIVTKTAIYFLEKSSGGFSSVIDKDGNDWVGFNKTEQERYPASAASDYRGIPNLIFGDITDAGAGHPGFDICQRAEKRNYNTIRFVSKSGQFVWRWIFFDDYVKLIIDLLNPEQRYWVLYEGPVGGEFDPESEYWGSNRGMHSELPDYYKGETLENNWQWVYFGDRKVNRVFFAVQEEKDELPDIMGFLGNTAEGLSSPDGMVVFGFGRNKKTQPLFTSPQSFYFGFYENQIQTTEQYEGLKSHLAGILNIQ